MDVEQTILDLCKRMETVDKRLALLLVMQFVAVLWLLLLTWSA